MKHTQNKNEQEQLLEAINVMQKVAGDIDSAKQSLDTLQRTETFFSRLDSGNQEFNEPESKEIILGDVLYTYTITPSGSKAAYMVYQ